MNKNQTIMLIVSIIFISATIFGAIDLFYNKHDYQMLECINKTVNTNYNLMTDFYKIDCPDMHKYTDCYDSKVNKIVNSTCIKTNTKCYGFLDERQGLITVTSIDDDLYNVEYYEASEFIESTYTYYGKNYDLYFFDIKTNKTTEIESCHPISNTEK